MMDWQAGDLALCVNTDARAYLQGIATAGRRLRKGAVYTVTAVGVHHSVGETVLWLAEDTTNSAGAWRFRKIKPLTDEEREQALQELKEPSHVS